MIFYDPKVMREPIGGDENKQNLGKFLGGAQWPQTGSKRAYLLPKSGADPATDPATDPVEENEVKKCRKQCRKENVEKKLREKM